MIAFAILLALASTYAAFLSWHDLKAHLPEDER